MKRSRRGRRGEGEEAEYEKGRGGGVRERVGEEERGSRRRGEEE